MKTKAAVLWGLHQKWEVEEVELDGPKQDEVLVKLTASGLCHSDDHLVTGDMPMQLPVVGGHEGAGVVVEVGPGVKDVAEGDPVVLSFIPACGRCEPCARGMSNLCVLGAAIIAGPPQLDGTFRFHARGQGLGQMCVLGTFSEYTVVPVSSVVEVDSSVALDTAALVGCGVTTGYGSAVRTGGETRDGDVVVVMGVGGIGINAVQGGAHRRRRMIVALDPVEYKRTRSLEFGATHAAATVEEAQALIADMTRGAMADVCVVSTDVAEGAYVAQALISSASGGPSGDDGYPAPGRHLRRHVALRPHAVRKKAGPRIAFSAHPVPRRDIPRLLELHSSGQLKLDELVTREYSLEDINQGYADMHAGVNLRGLIRF